MDTGKSKLNGFWSKAGPILWGFQMFLFSVIGTLVISSIRGQQDEIKTLRATIAEREKVYEVHLEKPHEGVEERLRAIEDFRTKGKRYTKSQGDEDREKSNNADAKLAIRDLNLAEIMDEMIIACVANPSAKSSLIKQVQGDIREFRAQRAQ